MMDLATIEHLNKKATRNAKRNAKQPWLPSDDQRARLRDGATLESVGARIPLLGDHVPRGWKRIEGGAWFVDTSGFGNDSEPAMTQRALARNIGADDARTGYALGMAGEFQADVQRYTKG